MGKLSYKASVMQCFLHYEGQGKEPEFIQVKVYVGVLRSTVKAGKQNYFLILPPSPPSIGNFPAKPSKIPLSAHHSGTI